MAEEGTLDTIRDLKRREPFVAFRIGMVAKRHEGISRKPDGPLSNRPPASHGLFADINHIEGGVTLRWLKTFCCFHNLHFAKNEWLF